MSKSKIGRGKWRIDLTVESATREAYMPPGYPFNNVDDRGREESRIHTLGRVLARIARRAEARRVANGKEDV